MKEISKIMSKEEIQIAKKAYQEILEVCEKHKGLKEFSSDYNDITNMLTKAKNHLEVIRFKEDYGIDLSRGSEPYSCNYAKANYPIREYVEFVYFKDAKKDMENGSGRYISWSDDNRQPENEWLLEISFPTGAYIFGGNYADQQGVFSDFIAELKDYKPDYTDSHNNSYYWKMKNCKKIYDNFEKILEKYQEINTSQLNIRRIAKLKQEIEKLEG